MIQEVITYMLISGAVLYTIYGVVKLFIPAKNKKQSSACSGCSACSVKEATKFQKL